MEPIIVTATFSQNPAPAGGTVLLRVAALDTDTAPSAQLYLSGEFRSGEV